MSVINKMLRELDRRSAIGAGEFDSAHLQVKAVARRPRGREWFWRCAAALLLAAVSWVGWVAYQLQPRTIVNEQALRLVMQPRSGPIVAASAPPAATSVPAPAPIPAPAVQDVQPKQAEPAPVVALPAEPPRRPRPVKPKVMEPKTVEAPLLPPALKGTVDKRDSAMVAGEAGEVDFQRAALFLKQGRVSEAQLQLEGALRANPAHLGARQAYVSLLLEQQRVDAAMHALQEAVTVNPGHPAFSLTLARIHVEQRNYSAALDAMDKAGAVAESAEFQSLRGTVLLRLGRHAEAVGAYEKAIRAAPQPGETWTAYGISLEAMGRGPDAAQAYYRALGAADLPRELREYAEMRIRTLE